MQRFFLQNPLLIKDKGVIHQMSRVLRMRTGEKFIALDNTRFEYLCELTSLSHTEAKAHILEKKENATEPKLFVTLYQAMPKKTSLFEFVLQKGTEIGVSKFIPLITDRTEREKIPKKERFEKILKEAAEQSERGKIPELGEEIDFKDALNSADASRAIILHGRGNHAFLSSKLNEIRRFQICDIFVGPEGGFSEEEIEKAREKGFSIVSLGNRVLRTETAGIVAASVLFHG